jgi:hypothetical protein
MVRTSIGARVWLAVLAVGLMLSLAACQTGAQRELGRLQAIENDMASTYNTCTRAAASRPEYANIHHRLSLPGTDGTPTLAQMQDSTRATPEDRAAFVAWHAELAACRAPFNESAGRISPQLAAAVMQSQAELDQIIVRVASSEITYGDGSRELAALYPRARARNQQAFAAINSRLEGLHAGEVQQRQAAAGAMAFGIQQYSLQQQMIAAQNRPQTVNVRVAPSTTNCYVAGGQLICNTQ